MICYNFHASVTPTVQPTPLTFISFVQKTPTLLQLCLRLCSPSFVFSVWSFVPSTYSVVFFVQHPCSLFIKYLRCPVFELGLGLWHYCFFFLSNHYCLFPWPILLLFTNSPNVLNLKLEPVASNPKNAIAI